MTAEALVPLCDWAKCLTCGTSHRTPVMAAPACCERPFVLSVCTPAPPQLALPDLTQSPTPEERSSP